MPEKLIEDIRPIPVKERSPLGVVELVLSGGQRVKAVGVVYGLEHRVSGSGYEATLFLDQYNQRIKILDYKTTDYEAMILHVRGLAEANGFDKIIFMAHGVDWQEFLKHGYVLEAVLKYFHRGSDAFIMSKFRSQERLVSKSLMEEILLIEKIIEDKSSPFSSEKPQEFEFRLARENDIDEMIELYQSIFETYPSPLVHRNYLETVFQKETLFAVCTRSGDIVSAASAELFPSQLSAELTDCATRSDARGKGLMSHILRLLEDEVAERGFICAYTMARARSYGMNNVFYRLNYEFLGRTINNCDIFGCYEDMNIWVKKLRN